MGMTNDGLSCWQAETEGIELLDTTIGNLLDRRHLKVADVQVVGIPDAFFSEELLAVVIPKAGK